LDKNFKVRGYQKIDYEVRFLENAPRSEREIEPARESRGEEDEPNRLSDAEIYEEFWEFIDDDHPDFQAFIQDDHRRNDLD
jgi:hypothetical protein